MSLFSTIGRAFIKFFRLFTSPAARKAYDLINDLVPQVAPIVRDLRVVDPKTATILDVVELYKKFKVSVGEIRQDPVALGNALLNLATTLAKRRWPGIATSIIQAAIQIALVGIKSEESV